uniref:Putative secreted protein n=1 Tax=Anopheles triannulatus TaxID=58253 RepID=A0A2M4B1D6_9DIPT
MWSLSVTGTPLLVRTIVAARFAIAQHRQCKAGVVALKHTGIGTAVIHRRIHDDRLEFTLLVATIGTVLNAVTQLIHWQTCTIDATAEVAITAQLFRWTVVLILSTRAILSAIAHVPLRDANTRIAPELVLTAHPILTACRWPRRYDGRRFRRRVCAR